MLLRLYHASGAGDYELSAGYGAEWESIRVAAYELLCERGEAALGAFLYDFPFDLFHATNHFGDEFSVLTCAVSPRMYAIVEGNRGDPTVPRSIAPVADAIQDVGVSFIRFITMTIDTSLVADMNPLPIPVSSPETVRRALADAELLFRTHGATRSLDRLHTALHGYLKQIAREADLPLSDEVGLAAVFALLRKNHPVFSRAMKYSERTTQVFNALSNIVAQLEPLRNNDTLAHANESLLGENEARLAVNATRALLQYLTALLEAEA